MSGGLWLVGRLFLRLALVPVPIILADQVVDHFAGRFVAHEAGSACRIDRIVDGDTVGIVCGSSGDERGRLMGFDAPELFSPKCVSELAAAERAKWALRDKLWSATTVRIETHGRDRYDRRLIRVFADGRDVSDAMISGGYARPYDGGPRGGWC